MPVLLLPPHAGPRPPHPTPNVAPSSYTAITRIAAAPRAPAQFVLLRPGRILRKGPWQQRTRVLPRSDKVPYRCEGKMDRRSDDGDGVDHSAGCCALDGHVRLRPEIGVDSWLACPAQELASTQAVVPCLRTPVDLARAIALRTPEFLRSPSGCCWRTWEKPDATFRRFCYHILDRSAWTYGDSYGSSAIGNSIRIRRTSGFAAWGRRGRRPSRRRRSR